MLTQEQQLSVATAINGFLSAQRLKSTPRFAVVNYHPSYGMEFLLFRNFQKSLAYIRGYETAGLAPGEELTLAVLGVRKAGTLNEDTEVRYLDRAGYAELLVAAPEAPLAAAAVDAPQSVSEEDLVELDINELA
jgi:hypothetical protein